MKRICLIVLLLILAPLAGCSSHPNNGEIPPASELPTPFPSASTAPATQPAPTSTTVMGKAASTPAPASSASSN